MDRKQDKTFEEVHDLVRLRATRQLPDLVVHIADVTMTTAGHLRAPDAPDFRLNGWARKQLASLLGIRWTRWFESASADERANEINLRLSRMPGELKVRLRRDETGETGAVARALLPPSYTAIDDLRIFDRLASTLGSALGRYRFTELVETESTTRYSAITVEQVDVGGDPHFPGFVLLNSEVAGGALTVDDYMLRQICSNGLMIAVDGKRLFYRTHRQIDDDQLAAALVIALSRLPARWATICELLLRAKDVAVPHPDAAVEAVLDAPDVPRALVATAQALALREGDRTRFGVVQAITQVAHALETEPDARVAMERLAGNYLAAA